MTLATERLRLRPWRSDDVEAWHVIWGDPEVIWWGANESLEQSRGILERLVAAQAKWQPGVSWFAVTRQDEEGIIGDVLLQPGHFGPGLEIGWHFRRDAWGQGYATEAAARVLTYAIEELEIERVYALVEVNNERSMRIIQKLGLARERELTYADLPHVLFSRTQPGTMGDNA